MINHQKILPCPFCGSTNVKIDPGNSMDNIPAYVFCRNCVTVGPSAPSDWEAKIKWNLRENNPQMVDQLLNIRQVSYILGVSRATIYRLLQKGNFPKPIHPKGTKLNRWLVAEIEAYKDESTMFRNQSDILQDMKWN